MKQEAFASLFIFLVANQKDMEENDVSGIVVSDLAGDLSSREGGRSMFYFSHYKVKDVMVRNPVTVDPINTLSEVAAIFEKYHLNGVPVVDGTKRLLALITKLDLLKACTLRKTDWFRAIARQRVSEVLRSGILASDPAFVLPETPLTTALEKMVQNGSETLPVVEDDCLIGIVDSEDVLDALRRADHGTIPARLISSESEGLLDPAST
jgi:CBS domain-containing protein